ncbi:MAG: acyl-CoA dehydratase activase [Deltaproteobacteria bacterium]|nr:acyl-CoA dehydratase activase [Deltaproteobacteria bacterium]
MRKGKIGIGVDCGSAFCKGALYQDGQIVSLIVYPTGWNIRATGERIVKALRGIAPLSLCLLPIVATGYGRDKILAQKTITEITCHARGAEFLRPGVRSVIDIGGQDYKVIAMEDGRATTFQMNDKCAAGTGRFLELVLGRLELDLDSLDALLAKGQTVTLNSTCVVFAESEIVGLLAQGTTREAILGGVVASMTAKIAGQAARVTIAEPAVLTGGLSQSREIAAALTRALGITVSTVENGLYAGAIGAAIMAAEIY